jgi:hypothetical protein
MPAPAVAQAGADDQRGGEMASKTSPDESLRNFYEQRIDLSMITSSLGRLAKLDGIRAYLEMGVGFRITSATLSFINLGPF